MLDFAGHNIPPPVAEHLRSCGYPPPFRHVKDPDSGELWLVQYDRAVFPEGSDWQQQNLPNSVEWAGVVKGGSKPDCLLTIACEDIELKALTGRRYLPHSSLIVEVSNATRSLLRPVLAEWPSLWNAALEAFVGLPPPTCVSDLSDFRIENFHIDAACALMLLVGEVSGFRLEWELAADSTPQFVHFGD